MDDSKVVDRINEYLQLGGLFNPELANHQAVRDLLIDCRNHIREIEMKVDTKTVTTIEQRVVLEMTEHEAKVITLVMGSIGGNHEFRNITGPLYHELVSAIGRHVYEKFHAKHYRDIKEAMFFRSKDSE